jgi:uncharacterized protein
VQRALDRLQDEKLVWRVMGGRAVRFDHNLDKVWHLKAAEKAIMTLLFLRGPQTPGELRGRSDRLHKFESVNEVEDTLRDMAAHSEPLVRELQRRPGQKETRWTHTVGGTVVEPEEPVLGPRSSVLGSSESGEPVSARVARLEAKVEELAAQLRSLMEKLGG